MSFNSVQKWELAKDEMALLGLTYTLRTENVTVRAKNLQILGTFYSVETLIEFLYGYKSGIMDHHLYPKELWDCDQ